MNTAEKPPRWGGFFAWSELRDVEDAVPYGRTGASAPTQCKDPPL